MTKIEDDWIESLEYRKSRLSEEKEVVGSIVFALAHVRNVGN